MYSRPLLHTFSGTHSQTGSVRQWNLLAPFCMCTLSHGHSHSANCPPATRISSNKSPRSISLQNSLSHLLQPQLMISKSNTVTEILSGITALLLGWLCPGSVWWRHLTSSIHQRRGCLTQDQLQAAEPYSAQQETNPQQLLEWLFHFIREPIKKKIQWAIQLLLS